MAKENIHRTNDDLMKGNIEPQPFFKVSRMSNMNLTTSWQRVDFNGSNTTNTFPIGIDGSNKHIYWDSTNRLFRFNFDIDRNFDIQFNTKIVSSSVLSVLNVALTNIQLRYVVPSPAPQYFPLPDDSEPGIDLGAAGLLSTWRTTHDYTIRGDANKRQYGMGVELRLSSSFLGTATATVNLADLIIYGR